MFIKSLRNQHFLHSSTSCSSNGLSFKHAVVERKEIEVVGFLTYNVDSDMKGIYYQSFNETGTGINKPTD